MISLSKTSVESKSIKDIEEKNRNNLNNSISKITQVTPSDKKEIKEYLDRINRFLDSGTQLEANRNKDADFLPSLLDCANNKYKGLNAHYCEAPSDMVKKIKDLINKGHHSARFLVGLNEPFHHYAAFEFLKKDDKLSVIGFEPSSFQDKSNPGEPIIVVKAMAFQSYKINEIFPNSSFAFIPTGIQNSHADCGMFSLSFVKQIFKDKDAMQLIHEKNLANKIKSKDGIVTDDEIDNFIPPYLMKHTQSSKRLDFYLRNNPDAEKKLVNKKNETLRMRQERYIGTYINIDKCYFNDEIGEKITYSNSIEHKRKRELENMLLK